MVLQHDSPFGRWELGRHSSPGSESAPQEASACLSLRDVERGKPLSPVLAALGGIEFMHADRLYDRHACVPEASRDPAFSRSASPIFSAALRPCGSASAMTTTSRPLASRFRALTSRMLLDWKHTAWRPIEHADTAQDGPSTMMSSLAVTPPARPLSPRFAPLGV